MTRTPMSIQVRGVTYPSAKLCAAALGVKVGTVYAGLYRDNPDTIGLGASRSGARGKPFSYRTLHWPSNGHASVALGLNRGYVGKALRGPPRGREVLEARLAAYFLQVGA